MSDLARLIALWFGCGASPKAPGTVGSLAAVPSAWLLMAYGGTTALLSFTVIVTLLGWWAAAMYVRQTGKTDPSEVVVDEVAGQSLTYGLAFLVIPPSLWAYGLGFVLFRLFDIIKRGPVGWADRHIPGGLGIMVDDLVAGVLAATVLILMGWGGLLL